MPSFDIAHLREQGQDIIIVPLDPSFGSKTSTQQSDAVDELQFRAAQAGLRGTVCVVWERSGRFHFIAPRPWRPFFDGLSMAHVAANINRALSW